MACLVDLFSDLAILHRDRAQPELQKLFDKISEAIQELPDLYDVNSEVEDLRCEVSSLQDTIEEKVNDSDLEDAKEEINNLESDLEDLKDKLKEILAPKVPV